MRKLVHLGAAGLAVALLVAPAAWVCCPTGVDAAPCPMESMASTHGAHAMASAAMPDAHGDPHPAPCHQGSSISSDCCDVSTSSAPVLGAWTELGRLLGSRDVAARPESPPPAAAPGAVPLQPPNASRLHDLGRYTLFSALLL